MTLRCRQTACNMPQAEKSNKFKHTQKGKPDLREVQHYANIRRIQGLVASTLLGPNPTGADLGFRMVRVSVRSRNVRPQATASAGGRDTSCEREAARPRPQCHAVGPCSPTPVGGRSWKVEHVQTNCKSPHGSKVLDTRTLLEDSATGHRAAQLVLIDVNGARGHSS